MTTGETFRIGLIQMRSGRAPAQNVDTASKLIREAKSAGATYVQTPEMTNIMEMKRDILLTQIGEEENDTSLSAFRELARETGIHIHIGSLALKIASDRAVNRGYLIDPAGELVASYDKIHMFDVDLANGESYRESRTYRALAEAGASFLAIPSAFTRQTGEAHWQTLMRARAIETGCFVLAAAQGGTHENGRETYGHSIVVDPWGRVIAEGGTEPGIVMAEINVAEITTARARVPSLQHGRRFEVVAPLAEPAHLHVVGGKA